MKVPRLIIFETEVGSRLYGTHRPDSDHDYMGIFLPSTDDMLGMQNCPSEWTQDEKKSDGDRNTLGDIDRKYFSVQKFLKLAAEGQSGPLEMLFAPKNNWIHPAKSMGGAWDMILKNRDLFVSKQSINPIIGFATAQAHRAVLKGDNLNLVRRLIKYVLDSDVHMHSEIGQHTGLITGIDGQQSIEIFNETIPIWYDQKGMRHIKVAGRSWPITAQVRLFHKNLRELEGKYGTRSEAAAEGGFDYKSLMHAYRLIIEAEQILTHGEIILPFDSETVKFLTSIRNGEYKAEYFDELEFMMTSIRQYTQESTLQDKPDYSKINAMCQEILYNHLFVYNGEESWYSTKEVQDEK